MAKLDIGLVVDYPLSSFLEGEHQTFAQLSPCKFVNGRIKWLPDLPPASFWKVVSNGCNSFPMHFWKGESNSCPIIPLQIYKKENWVIAKFSPFEFLKENIMLLLDFLPSSFSKGKLRRLFNSPHAIFWGGEYVAQFSPFEFLKWSIKRLLNFTPLNFWNG